MACAKILSRCLQHSMMLRCAPIKPHARHFGLTACLSDKTLFSKHHEYLKITGATATLGITDHAQKELGDVVYVDLPEVEQQTIEKEDVACSLESVKAVADVYMPVSGKILAVNNELEANPGLVNTDPYGEGWLLKYEIINQKELETLMDEKAYEEYLLSTD